MLSQSCLQNILSYQFRNSLNTFIKKAYLLIYYWSNSIGRVVINTDKITNTFTADLQTVFKYYRSKWLLRMNE